MKEKRNEILKGGELLRVASLLTAISNTRLAIGILLQIIGYIVVLVAGRLWLTTSDMQYLALVLAFTILFAVIIYLISLHKYQGNPLIIAERGIVIWPLITEFWKDIKSYHWEEIERPKPMPVRGICLRIKVNNNCLRNLVYDLFGTYLTLFPAEQQSAAEGIFEQHGIVKDKKNRNLESYK
jgi:hypothetical protein